MDKDVNSISMDRMTVNQEKSSVNSDLLYANKISHVIGLRGTLAYDRMTLASDYVSITFPNKDFPYWDENIHTGAITLQYKDKISLKSNRVLAILSHKYVGFAIYWENVLNIERENIYRKLNPNAIINNDLVSKVVELQARRICVENLLCDICFDISCIPLAPCEKYICADGYVHISDDRRTVYYDINIRIRPTLRDKFASYAVSRISSEKLDHNRNEDVQGCSIQNEFNSTRLFHRIKSAVSNWNNVPGTSLNHNYLFEYYPNNCKFELTEEEKNIRKLIWDFKNSLGKITVDNHNQALNFFIPLIVNKLLNTFDDDLSRLTFVCIPASSQISNSRRYEKFSNLVCSQTGMSNAYEHIQVKGERVEKHSGEGENNDYSIQFDTDFFHDKYVLLFDDIITTGTSLIKYKVVFEKLGAYVIAGFTIGKTFHERPVDKNNK